MRKDKLLRWSHIVAAVAFWPAVAVIAWGELTPQPPSVTQLVWDKAEHFTAYFGLAAMATVVVGLRARLSLAILGVILLGGALEILQGYTGRDPDIWDFVANTLGASTGTLLAAIFLLVLRRPALVPASPDN